MTNPYGPVTAIDAGGNPQLSSFWRQRLTMPFPRARQARGSRGGVFWDLLSRRFSFARCRRSASGSWPPRSKRPLTRKATRT